MEIIDYLRILRRRVLVLVLVPLVAVLAAIAWAVLRPPTYAAVATVNGNALVGTTTSQFTGPQGVSQFVAAFGATANGPYVLNVVSDTTKVPVRDLRDGLLITAIGDSASMRVAYTSSDRDAVEPVLTATVRETLASLFQPRADQAARDRDAAAEELGRANAEAEALAQKQGDADPRDSYQALVGKISSLEQQQSTLRANGNAVAAAALDASLKAARAKAVTYGPILAEYSTVEAKQRAASDALSAAQSEFSLATGQLSATTADRVVFVSGVSSAAAASEAWALVLPVLGAGIFVALVLVPVLELVSRARRQGRREDEPADDAAEPDDAVRDGDDTVATDTAVAEAGEEPAPEPETAPVAEDVPAAEPVAEDETVEEARAEEAEPVVAAEDVPAEEPVSDGEGVVDGEREPVAVHPHGSDRQNGFARKKAARNTAARRAPRKR